MDVLLYCNGRAKWVKSKFFFIMDMPFQMYFYVSSQATILFKSWNTSTWAGKSEFKIDMTKEIERLEICLNQGEGGAGGGGVGVKSVFGGVGWAVRGESHNAPAWHFIPPGCGTESNRWIILGYSSARHVVGTWIAILFSRYVGIVYRRVFHRDDLRVD